MKFTLNQTVDIVIFYAAFLVELRGGGGLNLPGGSTYPTPLHRRTANEARGLQPPPPPPELVK